MKKALFILINLLILSGVALAQPPMPSMPDYDMPGQGPGRMLTPGDPGNIGALTARLAGLTRRLATITRGERWSFDRREVSEIMRELSAHMEALADLAEKGPDFPDPGRVQELDSNLRDTELKMEHLEFRY